MTFESFCENCDIALIRTEKGKKRFIIFIVDKLADLANIFLLYEKERKKATRNCYGVLNVKLSHFNQFRNPLNPN